MDHTLQLELRFEAGTGVPTLTAGGCLTVETFPSLLRVLNAAARASAAPVSVDVRGARHLDPDVLLGLRALTRPATAGLSGAGGGMPLCSLLEPAELPVCLAHVGIDGEVLTRLDTGPRAHAAFSHGSDGQCGDDLIAGSHLCGYLDGTLDPGSTVRALSTEALEQLIDALFRHLDSPAPSFAARTWFELATEEHQARRPETLAGSCPGEDTG